MKMSYLQEVSHNVWTYNGSVVSWYGMPYTTRMTVIKLSDGNLWIHSPEKIQNGLLEEIKCLGSVKYLISPNKIHHLFIQDWMNIFPDALVYSSPGLKEKRLDVKFDKELSNAPEKYWSNDIDQIIFKGSKAMEEVVFFHRKSKTLILTDLIENFHKDHFTGYQRILAKITGIIDPNGKTPLDWRVSFMFGKAKARQCLKIILDWKPKIIILSHGECVYEDAIPFLFKSFSWLNLPNNK